MPEGGSELTPCRISQTAVTYTLCCVRDLQAAQTWLCATAQPYIAHFLPWMTGCVLRKVHVVKETVGKVFNECLNSPYQLLAYRTVRSHSSFNHRRCRAAVVRHPNTRGPRRECQTCATREVATRHTNSKFATWSGTVPQARVITMKDAGSGRDKILLISFPKARRTRGFRDRKNVPTLNPKKNILSKQLHTLSKLGARLQSYSSFSPLFYNHVAN
jgi:hypothetical protein